MLQFGDMLDSEVNKEIYFFDIFRDGMKYTAVI